MERMASHDRKPCNFCGGNHRFVRGQCRAWGHNCNKCGGRNHFTNKCKKSGKNVHNIEPTDSPTEDDEEVDYITSIAEKVCSVGPSDKRHFAKEIYSEMLIDDKSVIFQMDCGSSINIIPKYGSPGGPDSDFYGSPGGPDSDFVFIFRRLLFITST